MTGHVRELTDDGQVTLAAATLLHLRPQHHDATTLAGAIGRQRRHGYRLLASFEDPDAEPAAVAGFRIVENLAWGRFLYVDDLVTHPGRRGSGHGSALLAALDQLARAEGCARLHLDSGVGEERRDAHQRYFRHGMRISSYHFAKDLD